jgi:predicted secreted protein
LPNISIRDGFLRIKNNFKNIRNYANKLNDARKTHLLKAGIDKNPNPTAADRIAGAKKMAKSGTSMKKCKYGCK